MRLARRRRSRRCSRIPSRTFARRPCTPSAPSSTCPPPRSDGLDDDIREEAGDEDENRGGSARAAGVNELDRAAAERTIACQILPGISDASPPVRVETAVALGRLACVHSMLFRSAAAWWRRGGSPRPSSQGGFSSDGGAASPGVTLAVAHARRRTGTPAGSLRLGEKRGGVHAASPEGPYEPAFGTLGYRDPSVDNLAAAGNAGGNKGPGSPPHPHGGTNHTTFASADAARGGGGSTSTSSSSWSNWRRIPARGSPGWRDRR